MKTTINNKLGVITVALLLSGLVPSTMMAQDKVEASVGADLVSGYIWRGQDLGGVSVQPSLEISYKGFSLGAWGSVGVESKDAKEFDLTIGYSIGGFSVSITDYWFDKTYTGDVDEYGKEIYTTNKYFQYGAYSTAHVFEAQVGYDFGPLAVNWYTNFAGADGVKEKYLKDDSLVVNQIKTVMKRVNRNGVEQIEEIATEPIRLRKPANLIICLKPLNHSLLDNRLYVRGAKKLTVDGGSLCHPEFSILRYPLLPLDSHNAFKQFIKCIRLKTPRTYHYALCCP